MKIATFAEIADEFMEVWVILNLDC